MSSIMIVLIKCMEYAEFLMTSECEPELASFFVRFG